MKTIERGTYGSYNETTVNSRKLCGMSAKASGLEMKMINRRVRTKLSVMLAGLMLFSEFSALFRPQMTMSAVQDNPSITGLFGIQGAITAPCRPSISYG